MKIYVVVDTWDTRYGDGTNIEAFTDKDKAQTYMKEQLEQSIRDWNFNNEEESEEHYCCIQDDSATLYDDCDVENWVVFEREIAA